MYIKFFRPYDLDKTEEDSANLSSDSKLSVDVEREKGNQSPANVGLWRAACLCLSIICLLLILTLIVLGVKLQTGSTVCPDGEKTTTNPKLIERCSLEWCQTQFHQPQRYRCQECPKGWWRLDQTCFFLSTFRLSWDESQRNCSSRGGSLSVINSLGVQSFLTKKGFLTYWIGLRNIRSWLWVDNSRLGMSYWSDVPDDGDCVTLDTAKPREKNWVKARCQQYSYFICQLEL